MHHPARREAMCMLIAKGQGVMKPEIHPKYQKCIVTCGCGHSFETRSAVPTISVEICSSCHPFFTGMQKFVDTAGRVEKFQKKFGGNYFRDAKKAPAAPAAPAKA